MDEPSIRPSVAAEHGVAGIGDTLLHPPAALPEHLISLPDPSWALWRWAGLRSAGFPAAQVLQLAMPACAAAADRFIEREAEAEQWRRQARRALVDEIKEDGGEERTLLSAAQRQVKLGRVPGPLPGRVTDKTRTQVDAFAAACAAREQARAELSTQFATAMAQNERVLREVACDRRFREAVIWQNRDAIHTGIDRFLSQSPAGNAISKQRKHGHLIALYLQRYCTKNDTIGFFAPVGWVRWVSSGDALEVHPGPGLLAARTVYFETWAIDALGEMLAQDPARLPWAVPRPMPFLSLEGTLLRVPFAHPLQLSQLQAAVFAACDGRRMAREIAADLLRVPALGLMSEAEVFTALEHLRVTRRIAWTFEVSAEAWYPERVLREQLERITARQPRETALAALERLEAAREAVTHAAGDEEQLDQALREMEATFTELTARAASRERGKTYAARTLVYEDCRRNVEVTLGPELLVELGRPLGLLLTSARWLTYAAAQLYRRAFQKAYQELAQQTGSVTVEFADYCSWIQALLLVEPVKRLVDVLVPALQARWASILALPEGQWRVSYTSAALQERVAKVFAAPGPGWRSACYHSPDVLLAASGAEAIQRGDYQFVLGECHLARNTLDAVALVAQHPAPSELFEAAACDLPEPLIVAVAPRHALSIKRTQPALVLPKDRRLIFASDSCGIPPPQGLRSGELVVEEVAGQPVVRSRDGQQQFDLLEIFATLVSLQIAGSFSPLCPSSHTPRITIDRLVVCREAWQFAPSELGFAFSKDEMERYIGARRWARTQGLPRFVFVRIPGEQKPYYVDLDSPIYVDLLAKAIRQAAVVAVREPITVTEMLPDPEHLWLVDAEGNRYTSEIRVVAVDQRRLL